MKYTFNTLHQLLLRMRSLNYPQYKDQNEIDILITLLNREQIIDYSEIEWCALRFCLFNEVEIYSDIPWTSDSTNSAYQIKLEGRLEDFISRIIPREESVRLLTFFRDNCVKVLFDHAFYLNVEEFEDECARLIHKNIEESKRDQIHGAYLDWPRPNLARIAQGTPFNPKMSKEDMIIAKHMPSYSHDIGAFPTSMIIYVAHEFVDAFMRKAAVFQSTGERTAMPNMSQAAYIDPIRYRLMQLADRYMYFEKEPAYQTIWAIGVLLKSSPKDYWCREKFANGILDYLDRTKEFCNTQESMERAVSEISQLTQPQLFPEEPVKRIEQVVVHPTRPHGVHGKQLVEELATMISEHTGTKVNAPKQPFDIAQFIVVNGDLHQDIKHEYNAPVGTAIGNVERLNINRDE